MHAPILNDRVLYANFGPSPSGKAQHFDCCIRRFESGRASSAEEYTMKNFNPQRKYRIIMIKMLLSTICAVSGVIGSIVLDSTLWQVALTIISFISAIIFVASVADFILLNERL